MVISIALLFILQGCPWWPDKNTEKVVEVDCKNQGSQKDSLADVVKRLNRGGTVLVSGECNETRAVVITQDDVVIDGQGEMIIGEENDNVFTVIGKNVTIKNFKDIRGGLNGITVRRQGSLRLENVTISNNKEIGVLVGDEKQGRRLVAEMIQILEGSQPPQRPLGNSIDYQGIDNSISWFDGFKGFSLNPIGEAWAQPAVSRSGTFCNANFSDQTVAVVFIGSGSHGLVQGNAGCTVTISGHSHGGLVTAGGAVFEIDGSATVRVQDNNWIGVGAWSQSRIDARSGQIQTPSGHDIPSCRRGNSTVKLPGSISETCPAIPVLDSA